MNRDQARRDGLQQGRKLRRNYGRRVACWICDAIYMAAILGAVALFILMLGGCIEVPRVYVENGVRFHEGDTSACERGAAACTVNMRDVYYARGDMFALEHERDHLRGMQHGQWASYGYDVCAKVTVSGATRWHVGALLCRRADGNFYERAM